jgi:acyl-CoA thioesterase-1
MYLLRPLARTAAAALIAALASSLTSTGPAGATDGQDHACTDAGHLAQLTAPLSRTARRVAADKPLTILALGSSSTAGAGATSPAASYPSRLAVELKSLLPGLGVTVLNRGVNGEEAPEMLARFDHDGPIDKPDLVLWQLGTNSVLRDRPLGPYHQFIRAGLARMKALGADVVLIDPQFAPKVLAKPDAENMVKLIAASSMKRDVDLFPRFAIMREWRETMGFEDFLAPDQLHMNDWGYACLAKLLGAALTEAATRPVAAARAITR